MPLPILHSYAGYSLSQLAGKKDSSWKWALAAMFLANLADFDFLPGILMNDAARFHHGPSHSFGASVLCGLVLGFFNWLRKKEFKKTFILCTAAYASHVVLDLLGDRGGLPILWPLTDKHFVSPVQLWFGLAPAESHAGVRYVQTFEAFLRSVFSVSTLTRVFHESAAVALGLMLSGKIAVPAGFKKRFAPEPLVLGGVMLILVVFWTFAALRG